MQERLLPPHRAAPEVNARLAFWWIERPVAGRAVLIRPGAAVLDERQARIVEMKYFGGLSEEEVAAILSLSRTTITREWQSARAWLYRRMTVGRAATS